MAAGFLAAGFFAGAVAGGGRWIGLALIRRDVGSGVMVRAAGRDARVVDLPFVTPFVGPA